MKKKVAFSILVFLALVMTPTLVLFAETNQAFCTDAIVISGNETVTEEKSTKDLYIERDAVLTISGNVTVSNNVYVFGTLIINKGAKLTVGETLYCLKLNSMLSAGDYDYGIVKASGSISSNKMVVQDTYLSTPVPEIIHKNIVSEGAITPTCTEPGKTERKYCSDCGTVLAVQEDIPAEHKWNEEYTVDKAAKCSEEGSESIHCSVCGEIKEGTSRPIEKLAHNYGEWTTTKEPTCTEDGSQEKVCADCGDIVTEIIKSENHKWNDYYTVDKEPTCTEEGSESIHCSVCGEIKEGSSRVIVKSEHNYGEWTTTKEVTCTEIGTKEKVCTDCGDKVVEEIPVAGHQPGEPARENETKATCKEDGSYEEVVYCKVCKEELSRDKKIEKATGHSFGEWISKNELEHQRICQHDKSHVETESHTWDEGKITREPQGGEAGVKTYTCTVCGGKKTESVTVTITSVEKQINRLNDYSSSDAVSAAREAYDSLPDSEKSQLSEGLLEKLESQETRIKQYQAEGIVSKGLCGDGVTCVLDNKGTFTISGNGQLDYAYYTGMRQGIVPWGGADLSKVKKVVIEEGITNLGESMFLSMDNMEELILPDSITTFDFNSLSGNYKLKYFKIPSSVKEIGMWAFNGCNFVRIDIPVSVERISRESFLDCRRLTDIYYEGTEKQWNNIVGHQYIQLDTAARIHFMKAPVERIVIKGDSKQIAQGKKIQLKAVVSPSNANNKKLKWTSSNTKVATVNQNGLVVVRPKTGGKSVVITAAATDGSGKKATWIIKSMKGVVKKVAIKGKKKVKAGKALKLKAKVKATKGANKKLKWISSNPKWATVNGSGKVFTKKAGKGKSVKITAMATDGSGKKKVVTIKIK